MIIRLAKELAMHYAKLLAIAGLGLGLSLSAVAEDRIKIEQVQFKPGSSAATVKGSVKGKNGVDYVLIAKAGQTMSVALKGSASVNFNVLQPDEQADALFVGSMSGTKFNGVLPQDGKYKIRVYQMGNAASSGKTNTFTLQIAIH
jgi:hypothetical protein